MGRLIISARDWESDQGPDQRKNQKNTAKKESRRERTASKEGGTYGNGVSGDSVFFAFLDDMLQIRTVVRFTVCDDNHDLLSSSSASLSKGMCAVKMSIINKGLISKQ